MNNTTETLDTIGKVRLISGRYLNPMNLTESDIDLVDIAHGLAHRCRFMGHTQRFYSVAAHSLRVAELVPDEHRLAALLHDASEAYLFDIPSPLKPFFPELVRLENQVMQVIASRYRFTWPMHECIKKADRQALEEEWAGVVLQYPFFMCDAVADRTDFTKAVKHELAIYTL